jgi:hypothetical protein
MSDDVPVTEEYEATFSMKVPGQKSFVHKIRVKASSQIEAHVLSEDVWKEMVKKYSITVSAVENVQVAS